MSDKVTVNTFPSTRASALTMLYLEKQDLSGLTPEALVDMYKDTSKRIGDRLKETSENSQARAKK